MESTFKTIKIWKSHDNFFLHPYEKLRSSEARHVLRIIARVTRVIRKKSIFLHEHDSVCTASRCSILSQPLLDLPLDLVCGSAREDKEREP